MGKIIGIDLGTTNSAMAVLEGDQPQIITNSDGDRTTPSVVAFRDGQRIIGKTALRQRVTNVDNTAYSVKRFIGRTYDELTDKDKEGLAYKVVCDEQGRPSVMMDENGDGQPEALLAEQISAALLSKMKDDATKFLGEPVTEAVITVPAYFNDNQRKATIAAGTIAGLNVQRIINEPTAAALAYGFDKGLTEAKKIMVFDLGGGTLDISILDVVKGLVQVISTAGDNHLGGDLWDSTLCAYIEKRFLDETGIDLSSAPMNHARVLEAARNAKHDLSNSESTNVNLPFIAADASGAPLNLDYDITREQFEDITKELLDRCRTPIEDAIHGAPDYPDMTFNDIDDVLLVGGSTRMPSVQKLVAEATGKTPEMTINPDEAVALGAAVQGGVLNGECKDAVVLADVTSMSLGIRSFAIGDSRPHVERMIERNTSIPTEGHKRFTTRDDNQSMVEIVIIQGEDSDPESKNNKVLGTTSFEGIPPMPAGQPQIDITLMYNTEGIVEVSAKELRTGKSMKATITGSTSLSDDEVQMLAAGEGNK